MKVVGVSNNYANQEFFVVVEGVNYGFRLHTFRDMLYCDVTVGTDVRWRSVRCIDRTWLLPFGFVNGGNFRFEHEVKGTYPYWKDLGNRCKLVWYAASEQAEAEAS